MKIFKGWGPRLALPGKPRFALQFQPFFRQFLIPGSIIAATLGLVLGYGFRFSWLWPVLGLCWLVGQRRGWPGVINGGLLVYAGAAALGVWQGLSAGWLLFSSVAALVAWDLAHFDARLQRAGFDGAETDLQAAHLRRLAPVAGLGWLLGELALLGQIKLKLGWAILLGLVAILALSRMIGAERGEE